MTRIEFSGIHDIVVSSHDGKTVISFRDIRWSDVDIVLKNTDIEFLTSVLNEALGKERDTEDAQKDA